MNNYKYSEQHMNIVDKFKEHIGIIKLADILTVKEPFKISQNNQGYTWITYDNIVIQICTAITMSYKGNNLSHIKKSIQEVAGHDCSIMLGEHYITIFLNFKEVDVALTIIDELNKLGSGLK